MMPTSELCSQLNTKKNARWLYYEYYMGDKDQENRRAGEGHNQWTGAESIEWYKGNFTRDTMHGTGTYRWRYLGAPGLFVTYEGNFYVNRRHGYGVMSYPDGKVFTGIFNNDVRYGPGIESFADRHQNVGLWRGARLLRLAWRPAVPSVIPELHVSPIGKEAVEPHRIVLNTTFQTIGKINNAIELFKECGSDPVVAAENWTKLYPRYCTDTASELCQVELFKHEYYEGKIYSLKRQDSRLENDEEIIQESQDSFEDVGPYYAWNNDETIINMMKQAFKHEKQRSSTNLDLMAVLSGPRDQFLPAARHELDSRTLLLASYLGHVASTTFLVNERGVNPNITDVQGNSAVMYAACGDQTDILNFLIDAGGNVDSYNDSCCTALGTALLRFTCTQKDISIGGIAQTVLPSRVGASSSTIPQKAFEWNIVRDLPPPNPSTVKSPSKIFKPLTSGPERSNPKLSIKELPKKKTEVPKPVEETGSEPDEYINDENKLYKKINNEYIEKVNEVFQQTINPPTYLFEVYDMVKDVDDEIVKEKGLPEKNKKKEPSKVIKETAKPSKEAMWQNLEKNDDVSLTSTEKYKAELLERIKKTISSLLDKGADPNLVRYPQPALFVAIISGCSDLVRLLLDHGANANETFSEIFGYTILDIAVSRPMTLENLEIIGVLLEYGATVDHRLRYNAIDAAPLHPDVAIQSILGPTLLHAVLARKLDTDHEEDIRKQVLELLLEYNCDPLAQFKGVSAFDIATKNTELLDIVIRNPTTNLNAIINDSNQTILVKMFSMPYFKTIESKVMLQTLTNLLLFGADPFLECQNGDSVYKNLFVLLKKLLSDLEGPPAGKQTVASSTKINKAKKEPKKEEKSKTVGVSKSNGKMTFGDVANLRQAIDLIIECARLMYIRWLQAKLTKELIQVVDKYKHRHWNIILQDYKNKQEAGLWLNVQRCLEIWDILKTTNRKIYTDKRTLKHLLCIVHFFYLRSNAYSGMSPVTALEKNVIEYDVNCMLYEHKKAMNFASKMLSLQRLYVQPELFVRADSKFKVCFECFLPLEDDSIKCQLCKLVSFCNSECMKVNIERTNCHPCSAYLKNKFFPSPLMSEDDLPTSFDMNTVKEKSYEFSTKN